MCWFQIFTVRLTGRQTDRRRKTDTQTDRRQKTDSKTDRQTDRQKTDSQPASQTDRPIVWGNKVQTGNMTT